MDNRAGIGKACLPEAQICLSSCGAVQQKAYSVNLILKKGGLVLHLFLKEQPVLAYSKYP